MTTQCCMCKKVRVGNDWETPSEVTAPPSNTYCPACFERSLDALRAEQLALRQQPAMAAAHDEVVIMHVQYR